MQVFMNEQEIIQCLTRLGEELESFHFEQPLRILMIGGEGGAYGSRLLSDHEAVF